MDVFYFLMWISARVGIRKPNVGIGKGYPYSIV